MLLSQPSAEKLITETKSQLIALKALTTEATLDLTNKTIEYVKDSATNLVRGLEISESEIANHYLDGQKYGLAGSDGSCWSNYFRYYQSTRAVVYLLCRSKKSI
jgi:hypothetical protein